MIPVNNTSIPTNMTSDSGVTATTATLNMDIGGLTVGGVNLIWLPYVVLTLILLGLLVASFAHFHYKYRDRYIKRSHMAHHGNPQTVMIEESGEEGIVNGPYPITDELLSLASTDVITTGSTAVNQAPKSPKRTGRLKMLYGNKVDVDKVIESSMFEQKDKHVTSTLEHENSVSSLNELHNNDDDEDYINETYRLGIPRQNASNAGSYSGSYAGSTASIRNQEAKEAKHKSHGISVSVWSTGISRHADKQGKGKGTM